MDPVHEARLVIHPGDDGPLTVHLEPTGMQYDVAPGDRLTVVVRGPGTGEVDVVHYRDSVAVHPWREGEMTAFDGDGNELPV